MINYAMLISLAVLIASGAVALLMARNEPNRWGYPVFKPQPVAAAVSILALITLLSASVTKLFLTIFGA